MSTGTKFCTEILTAHLSIIALEATRCPSGGEWINHGAPRQWSIIQRSKEMSYQALKRHGGT